MCIWPLSRTRNLFVWIQRGLGLGHDWVSGRQQRGELHAPFSSFLVTVSPPSSHSVHSSVLPPCTSPDLGPRWGPGCHLSCSSREGVWGTPGLVPEIHGDYSGPSQSPLCPVCGEAAHQQRPGQSWPGLQSVASAIEVSW